MSDLRDLARWTIERTQGAGAVQSRVRIRNSREVQISYRGGKPDVIKEASSHVLVVEVFSEGRFSAQSTSDLRKDALADFINRAVFTTRLLASDPDRSLPDPRYYEGRSQADLELRDAAYETLTPDERHAIARQVAEACGKRCGDKAISVEASEFDERAEAIVMSSNGLEGQRETTSFGMGAVATVSDDGDRRPNGHYYVQTASRAALPSALVCGRLAAEHALEQLGGRKIATETLPIIVLNREVDRVLDGLLQAMYAANIQQQRSFLAERKGQAIGSDKLTILDDPLLPGGLGSRPYDGDGLATRQRVMIEAGVLRDFYTDWHYSRKLKQEPTIGSPSNLIIPAGARSVADIMKDLGRGILVTGFVGGNSNSTTGDFSTGILGRLFENGEPTQAIAEMNIASNHNEFWNKLIEVADDPWIYSSQRTPSLVFADVVVSGA